MRLMVLFWHRAGCFDGRSHQALALVAINAAKILGKDYKPYPVARGARDRERSLIEITIFFPLLAMPGFRAEPAA